MYQIKCTTKDERGVWRDYILFDNRYEDEELSFDLTVYNPKLKLETNKVGELTFTLPAVHKHFDKVKKLKSIIRVYQFKTSPTIDGRVIFKGRVIEDEQDFDNAKKIECESKLAMLIDSQTPPFTLEEGKLTVSNTDYSIDIINKKAEIESTQAEIESTQAEIDAINEKEEQSTADSEKLETLLEKIDELNGQLEKEKADLLALQNIDAGLTDASPASLFKWAIQTHNGQVEDWQRFALDETETTLYYNDDYTSVRFVKDENHAKEKVLPKYCTVIDANDNITRSSTNYATTYNTIESKFIELLGGYINVKYDVEKDGELVDYIEYVHDFNNYASQTLEFGENLLDVSQVVSGADVATVLIPLGKGDGDGETTIIDIPDGEYTDGGSLEVGGDIVKAGDRIYSKKWVAEYGKIVKAETWDDVTDRDNLFRKAIARLKNESIYLSATITLKAVDLALVDKDIESFYWQDKIKVFSRPHNITAENNENAGAEYLLEKIDVDLLEPQNTEIVLGKTWRTITDVALGAGKATSNAQTTINKIVADYATNEQVKEISQGVAKTEAETAINNAIGGEIETVIESAMENTSIIAQTAEEIIFEVVQNYVEKTGYEERQEDISATLQLLAEEMVLKFNTAIEEISTVDGEVQTQFQEISKYIRFIDGKIILGEVGNEITLEISNNRLSFLQNNLEVAYMSNNKLFVVNSEFLGSLKIGNFAFTPRSNGNLSLKLSTATTPTIEDTDDATQ